MRERAQKIKMQATILSQAWGTGGLVFGSRVTKLAPVNVPARADQLIRSFICPSAHELFTVH